MTAREKLGRWLIGSKAVNVSPKNPVMRQIFGWGSEKIDLVRPYGQIPIIYACINLKARNIAHVPWRVYPLGSESPIKSGPLFSLFEWVNPNYTKYSLWESVVISLETNGEAFVIIDSETVQGVPVALWPVHPDKMKPKFYDQGKGTQHVGWELSTGGKSVVFPREMVIHIKYHNPWDDIRGMSPTAAATISSDTMWASYRYNKVYFDNDGTPGSVYSTDTNLTDAQYNRMYEQFVIPHTGRENAHKPLLLEGGVKLNASRVANKDMQFLEGMRYDREDIMMVFQVPKSELGLDDQVNRATAGEQKRGFWKDTLVPLMSMVGEAVNTQFLTRGGYEGRFDIDSIDALNSEVLEKAEAATKFYAMKVPFNVINDRLKLGFPKIEGGDEPNGGALPPPMLPAPEDDEEPPKDPPEDEGKGLLLDLRDKIREAYWRKEVKKTEELEALMARAVKAYWRKTESVLMRRLFNRPKTALKESLNVEEVLIDLEKIISDEKLIEVAEPFIVEAVGLSSDVKNLAPEDVKRIAYRRLRQIGGLTDYARRRIRLVLRTDLVEMVAAGVPETEMVERLTAGIKDAYKKIGNHAGTIARTEVFGAYSEGRFEAYGRSDRPPSHKEWISMRDAAVRPSHQMLDGEIAGYNELFSNGLMYPHDPNAGDPGEVVNCRCVLQPIFGQEIPEL